MQAMRSMRAMLVLVVMVVMGGVGCTGGSMDTAKVAQLNDALHAYPDAAEAWVFMPLDASVYATQRFGIGQPTWVMLHYEKQSKANAGIDANAPARGGD